MPMSTEVPLYLYEAKIIRVKDGDTFIAELDVGFGFKTDKTFRLYKDNTPETWRPKTIAEKRHGQKATDFVKTLFEENGNVVYVKSISAESAIYGRWECQVYLNAEDYHNDRHLGHYLKENDLLARTQEEYEQETQAILAAEVKSE